MLVALAEQHPEALLDGPGGADLVRGVISGESGFEPGARLDAEVFVSGQPSPTNNPP